MDWQPVAVAVGLPREYAAVTFDTRIEFTAQLPPDGGRGPRIHVPTHHKLQGDALAWRAYLRLTLGWYREAVGSWGEKRPPLTIEGGNVWELCYFAPPPGKRERYEQRQRARAALDRLGALRLSHVAESIDERGRLVELRIRPTTLSARSPRCWPSFPRERHRELLAALAGQDAGGTCSACEAPPRMVCWRPGCQKGTRRSPSAGRRCEAMAYGEAA